MLIAGGALLVLAFGAVVVIEPGRRSSPHRRARVPDVRTRAFAGVATLDIDDRGRLMMSNLRLVFLGDRLSHDIPIAKILDITADVDGMKIGHADAKPISFTTRHPDDAVIEHRIATGDIHEHAATRSATRNDDRGRSRALRQTKSGGPCDPPLPCSTEA